MGHCSGHVPIHNIDKCISDLFIKKTAALWAMQRQSQTAVGTQSIIPKWCKCDLALEGPIKTWGHALHCEWNITRVLPFSLHPWLVKVSFILWGRGRWVAGGYHYHCHHYLCVSVCCSGDIRNIRSSSLTVKDTAAGVSTEGASFT